MIREIPILGKPSTEQREAFRAAKGALGITDALKFVEARPGCGRCLSFGPDPEFAADCLGLVGADRQDVEDALGWILDLRNEWRAATVGSWLEKTMGRRGVREL